MAPGTSTEEVTSVLNRWSIGRDHPAHADLVEGRLNEKSLAHLAKQQWHFHHSFPTVLQRLAEMAEPGDLRRSLTSTAQAHDPTRDDSPRALWERVAQALGVSRMDLEESVPTPATHRMISAQVAAVTEPFWSGYLAIAVGVYAEAAPWFTHRREAFVRYYGVTGENLRYFDAPIGGLTPVCPDEVCREMELRGASQALPQALQRLESVLSTRWAYFSEIGSAGM